MKKIIALATLGALGMNYSAQAATQSVSVGYATAKIKDFKKFKGINVKYLYEFDEADSLGILASLSYLSAKENQSSSYYGGILSTKEQVKYFSLGAGPSYRFNDFVSIYGLLGLAYSKVDDMGDWGDRSTVGWHDKATTTSFMYGVGLQFNATENLVVGLGYEKTSIKPWSKSLSINGFNISIGYRF